MISFQELDYKKELIASFDTLLQEGEKLLYAPTGDTLKSPWYLGSRPYIKTIAFENGEDPEVLLTPEFVKGFFEAMRSDVKTYLSYEIKGPFYPCSIGCECLLEKLNK